MANFATLLSTIAANIYTNNNNEIDADDLKGVLNTMVQELGQAGYIFAGVAVPSTSPGTPDSNVFYIAGKGTYSNFGSTVVGDGQIGVFAYNGSWSYNVLDTGAWFDVDVYPAEAALEMTFYDGSHPDGETIKINANVSNLGNSKLEAISAWWAAQKERRINEIGGFTIEKDSVVDSSPTTLGLFQYIAQGQIIDSITGATSLIFVSNDTPGQEVTVNAADLPYTAAKTFVSVKSPSGTLTNVKIHVEPENFVSVSQNTETGKTELLIGDTPVLIVDNEPEAGSDNLVKSGGVEDAIITNALTSGSGIRFSHTSVGGVMTKIATFNLKAGYQYQYRATLESMYPGAIIWFDLFSAAGTRLIRVKIDSGETTNISEIFTPDEDLIAAYISTDSLRNFVIDFSILQYVGTEELKDNSVSNNKLQPKCIDNSKLGNKSVATNNLDFLASKNLVDTQDSDYVVGKRLESDGSLSDGDYITTGFMPVVAGETYVFSAQTSETNIARFAILYNVNKEIITGGYSNAYKINGSTITIPETAKFYRVSYYSSASNLQFEKGTTPTSYEPYREVIPSDLLPQQEIDDDSITLEKVTHSVSQQKGLYISIPDNIYAVVGDKIQIFFRSIIQSANPYNYDVIAICSKGKSYPRYWEYTPVAGDAGDRVPLTIRVRGTDLQTIIEKTIVVNFVDKMVSPSSNVNVLCVGASATANGVWVNELKRRLTQNTGDGTPSNPTGLNLSNITFVGRKRGTSVDVPLEATGGWRVQDYASQGETAFRMVVTGVNELHIGDTYTSPIGGGVFVLQEINVTQGTGNLRFTFNSGIPTIPESGTLNRTSGSGDTTITYTSFTQETYSPFWNSNTNKLDFDKYAVDCCDGSIDVMIWHCGVNDIFNGTSQDITNAINAFKSILRQYHSDFPNGKVIISSVPVGSLNGGFAANYGSSNYANSFTFANQARRYSLALAELCADSEFSDYTYYSSVLEEFDSEYNYPSADTPVNNRSAVTEKVGTNAVHPLDAGSLQVADGIYRTFNNVFSN